MLSDWFLFAAVALLAIRPAFAHMAALEIGIVYALACALVAWMRAHWDFTFAAIGIASVLGAPLVYKTRRCVDAPTAADLNRTFYVVGAACAAGGMFGVELVLALAGAKLLFLWMSIQAAAIPIALVIYANRLTTKNNEEPVAIEGQIEGHIELPQNEGK